MNMDELKELLHKKDCDIEIHIDNKIEMKMSSCEEGYKKEVEVDAEWKEDVDIFELIENYRKTTEIHVEISELLILAQSAKAFMKGQDVVDKEKIAKQLYQDIGTQDLPILGVLYKEIHKGDIKNKQTSKKKYEQEFEDMKLLENEHFKIGDRKKFKRHFPNNLSLTILSPLHTGRKIHCKLFNNGNISMVGCKIKEDGMAVLRILEHYLKRKKFIHKKVKIEDYEITMINSMFTVNQKIDRKLFYLFFVEEYPNILIDYSTNSKSYSGVKISYIYNAINEKKGYCQCENKVCEIMKKGKKLIGNGNGVGQCKKITISIFQTGKVIITGGRNMEQIYEAYYFITSILREHIRQFILLDISKILLK